MSLIFLIIAIVAVVFGISQVIGGYAVVSGLGSIVFGVIIALQGCFGFIECIPYGLMSRESQNAFMDV